MPSPRPGAGGGRRPVVRVLPTAGTITRGVPVPDDLRALSGLDDPDYVYGCAQTAPGADDRRARAWAARVFAVAPRPVWWFVVAGWRFGLGLRLAPRHAADHVLGWTVHADTPAVAVLGAESWMLVARLVVRVEGTSVLHATLVRYRRAPARLVWALAAPVHQVVIPALVRRALRAPVPCTATR